MLGITTFQRLLNIIFLTAVYNTQRVSSAEICPLEQHVHFLNNLKLIWIESVIIPNYFVPVSCFWIILFDKVHKSSLLHQSTLYSFLNVSFQSFFMSFYSHFIYFVPNGYYNTFLFFFEIVLTIEFFSF